MGKNFKRTARIYERILYKGDVSRREYIEIIILPNAEVDKARFWFPAQQGLVVEKERIQG